MTPETLKTLLYRYNLNPNRTFGQNFLLDEFVLEDMLDTADVTSTDLVLEVGPGIGNLTEKLLQRAGFVVSVEKDQKFLPILKSLKKDHDNFSYVLGDILAVNLEEALQTREVLGRQGLPLSQNYKVVANIPYYITGKIVQVLLHAVHKPQSITILVQKEVAQNIVARPGHLNLLAISVQLYADVRVSQVVPAKSFYPAPKVDSAVIHIALHKEPRYTVADEKKLFRILRACFTGKRKQVHNTLVNNLHLPKVEVGKILHHVEISPESRPQQLAIEQWIRLADNIKLP